MTLVVDFRPITSSSHYYVVFAIFVVMTIKGQFQLFGEASRQGDVCGASFFAVLQGLHRPAAQIRLRQGFPGRPPTIPGRVCFLFGFWR
jgi:hypothetical protein